VRLCDIPSPKPYSLKLNPKTSNSLSSKEGNVCMKLEEEEELS
jgi:hypothetical protein